MDVEEFSFEGGEESSGVLNLDDFVSDAEQDRREFMSRVNTCCENLSPTIKQAIIDVCMMTKNGSNVIPRAFYDLKDQFRYFAFDYSVSLVSLVRVLTLLPCCRLDNGEKIISFVSPYRLTCETLPVEFVNNTSIVTERGIINVHRGSGEYVMEYIMPKYDGVTLRTLRYVYGNTVKGVVSTVVIAFLGSEIFYLPENTPVISGEVKDKICHTYYGIDPLKGSIKVMCLLGDTEIELRPSNPVSIDVFLSTPKMKNTDGYILGINGREFKVRNDVSIDLNYNGGSFAYSRNGTKYSVIGVPIGIRGICEFSLIHGCYQFERERADKLMAQTSYEVEMVRHAANYDYIRNVFIQFKGLTMIPYTDHYSMSQMITIINSQLKKNIVRNRIIVSHYVLRNILNSKRVHVTLDELAELYRIYGGKKQSHVILSADSLPVGTEVKYATRDMIHNYLAMTGYAGSSFNLARDLSRKFFVCVSARRIMLMAIRGELLSFDSQIIARKVGGIKIPFTSFVDSRSFVQEEINSYRDALVNYTRFNEGVHVTDQEIAQFNDECRELVDCELPNHVLEEVGDVLIMITKVILRLYTDGTALYDTSSIVWDILFNNDIMKPFVTKMEKRLIQFQCVRNHLSARAHVCCNGKEFVPEET